VTLTATMRDKAVRLGGTVGAARREGGVAVAARVTAREATGSLRRAGGYLVETAVDRRYGMTTRGIVKNDAVVRTGAGDGCYYQATPVVPFRRLVRESGVAPARTAFVDLGAGRGRALMLAAHLGFREVVGVELDPELAATARRNAAAWHARRPRHALIEVRTADAAQVAFPEGDLFVFLFNPFGAQTLDRVLDGLTRAVLESPRRLTVAYMNPVHADVLATRRGFRRTAQGRSWVVHQWDPASRPSVTGA